jgi:hypothetical protein
MSVSITQVPKNLEPVFQASANACWENASKHINVFALAVVVESSINYEKDGVHVPEQALRQLQSDPPAEDIRRDELLIDQVPQKGIDANQPRPDRRDLDPPDPAFAR